MKGRTLLVMAAAGLVGTIVWMLPSPRPARLPDGTLVRLTRLKFDDPNIFPHGSALERALGDFIPTNGLGVGSLRLRRPKGANPYVFERPVLSLEFQLFGPEVESGRSRVVSPGFNREFRLVILGEDNFPYVEEFQKTATFPDGVFIYINATAYPRRSRTLRFLLQHHDSPLAPWRTVAEFQRRNAASQSEEWTAETPPVRRTSNQIEFVVGQVTVEATHSNQWQSFWATTVKIPFQVRQNGIVRTNWNLHQVQLEDTSGNLLRIGGSTAVEKGWNVFTMPRSLDPRTVWNIRAGVAPASDFGPSNVFTLQVVLPRIPAVPFTTNIAGYDFRLMWTSPRTVKVELDQKSLDTRLALAGAWDEQGQNVGGRISSAGQFEIWMGMTALGGSPPNSPIRIDAAVVPNLPVEFTIQPQLIESGGRSWLDSMNAARTNSP